MNKRVKVTITGYYNIDMSKAEANYLTTDPTEMLEIDKRNILNYPEEMLDSLEDGFEVELSWEN